MVVDFSDIKRQVKGWIGPRARSQDDHSYVATTRCWNRCSRRANRSFVVDENPTVEHIAYLIFAQTQKQGFPVVRVTVWETPSSFATYREDGPAEGPGPDAT